MCYRIRYSYFVGAIGYCVLAASLLSGQQEVNPPKKPATVELQVEVTDAKDGRPLDNVQILVRWGTGDAESQRAVTNKSGVAKLKDVPRGTVVIRLIANSYKTLAPTFDLKAEKQPIKIALEKAAPDP